MYIDKLIKKEVITLLISVSLLVIIFIGVTYAKFLSVDKGQDTVINMGDLNISFCKDTTCDSTYTNIGQVIGTKVENGASVPANIYPFKNDGSYSNETPYIFKVDNTGSLDSTVKIKLKEDASFTPSGDYSSYARLTSKYADHLKVAIRKIILYEDTGYQIGDVDMNGIVNKKDANLILDSLPTFTDLQRRLADFNRDGTINTSDSSDIYDMVYNRGTSNAFEKIYTYTFSELEDGVIWKNEIIKSGDSVAYSLWLYLDETTPNDAQNTFFVGNIDVEGEFIPKNTILCTTNTELTQGAEYVNGQYTYRYMQEGKSSSSGLAWQNITSDGWGVQLTDKASTDAVNSEVCTYINNKPITSMASMFANSKATSIDLTNINTSKVTEMGSMFDSSQATTLDLSSFNTSNVTNMSGMFSSSKATTLDVSNFDTSKVTDMSYIFFGSKATTLDVSNFDTSSVTNMGDMFSSSKATTLDVSNFDTSKVTDMSYMFFGSKATTLDLSNFDTSKVTEMGSMFDSSQATTLDLSSFNTSNVTNMSGMFYDNQATTLDLSSFNTSNVTDMSSMFDGSQATTLDLSSFNTSNVTDMSYMFRNSQATTLDLSSFNTSNVTDMNYMFYSNVNLKTIYVSNKFNTNNVTSSTDMFTASTKLVGGAGTKYNSSYINITYARIDGGTSNPGYFTDIADKPKEPESFATDSWKTIIKAVKNNNISKYKIGDTKTIDMGTYGTHTLRIANTSTPSECSRTGFSQTACGFVLEFADIITEHKMNNTDTNVGGWPASKLRTYLNNDIYNAIPSEIKNGIIDTTIVSSHGPRDSSNFTSTDKLYLLAPGEVWSDWKTGSEASYDTAKDLTRQLDYYKNEGVRTTYNYSKAIKMYNSNALWWWLRSAHSGITGYFYYVLGSGEFISHNASNTFGVSPAFRLG